ncbi:NADH dehydrogenase (Ubiquinone) 1 beta subcomplex, 10 [Cichlidogyrus casuarinus]|uniref:NADH dehydrogenase [ubiquinone] 1 beta subcomplex subunit 10 n=1 Tax=Cichlidogyrus casuarinus TaxID=1844966 RepID=A0ABD2PYJ9_9PLAT
MGEGHGEHDSHHAEPTREMIFAPMDFSPMEKYFYKPIGYMVDWPVTFFKTQIVDRVRVPTYTYHERIPRVPTIDECKLDDDMCIHFANTQFKRDRRVDKNIIHILQQRFNRCQKWHQYDDETRLEKCARFENDLRDSQVNYFIKYQETAHPKDVVASFMKQKHRMLWERRYGEVGNGKSGVPRPVPEKKEKTMHDYMAESYSATSQPKEMKA